MKINQESRQASEVKFSTTDHLHALNQAIEKANEYNLKLCVGYIDYEKQSCQHLYFQIREELCERNERSEWSLACCGRGSRGEAPVGVEGGEAPEAHRFLHVKSLWNLIGMPWTLCF